jgi:hypothetical protein
LWVTSGLEFSGDWDTDCVKAFNVKNIKVAGNRMRAFEKK